MTFLLFYDRKKVEKCCTNNLYLQVNITYSDFERKMFFGRQTRQKGSEMNDNNLDKYSGCGNAGKKIEFFKLLKRNSS